MANVIDASFDKSMIPAQKVEKVVRPPQNPVPKAALTLVGLDGSYSLRYEITIPKINAPAKFATSMPNGIAEDLPSRREIS